MGTYRFYLIGVREAFDLEVVGRSLGEIAEIASRQRFLEGRLTDPDESGEIFGLLVATSRIQCVRQIE